MYGAEKWALTSRLMDVLHKYDCRILRYKAEVRWQDGRSTVAVIWQRTKCGVEDLSVSRHWEDWEMVCTCEKCRGGFFGWAGWGESWGTTSWQEVLGKSGVIVWWGVYELVGSGGECGAGLTDVDSSHRSFNPILDGKMQTLNKNDDDDKDDLFLYNINGFLRISTQHLYATGANIQ